MANYHLDNALGGTQQAMSSSYKTVIECLAQTTGIKRTRWYGFNIGPSGNPASTDTDLQADISRATATATATAATALPTDPNEGAATSSSKVNATGEGTVTATSSLWYGAMNQRGTFTWQTNDVGQMLVGPATNNAGLVLRAKSAGGYTNTVGGGVFFNE
jgi:hypothetical protein